MAFEPVYEVAALESRHKLCSDQIVAEARLIPPHGVAISKILAITCTPYATATEVFTGEIRYKGKVDFKVLFMGEDSANHCMDYSAEFADKLVCQTVTNSTRATLSAKILDTDITGVSGGELKIAAVVELDAFANVSQRIKFLARGGEGIYTHDSRMDYCRLTSEGSDTFNLTETVSGLNASKLLLTEAKAVILKREAGIDCIMIEGKVAGNLILETADGMIASQQITTAFSQQISAPGAHPNQLVMSDVRLKNTSVHFESDGETAGAGLEFSLEVRFQLFADEAVTPIIDVFSVKNELLTATESMEIRRNKLCMAIEDRVEGSVTLDINMPIVDNILATAAAKLHISAARAMEGKALLEGVVSASILYYSAELNSKNSLAVELPFSFTLPCPVAEGDELELDGEVTEVFVKIRRGNELDIKAGICMSLNATELSSRYVISEITIGEEIEVPDSALSIHIARPKETLWDVAKALCTTPELILLQNPNLTLPLSGGERIITYRHLRNE